MSYESNDKYSGFHRLKAKYGNSYLKNDRSTRIHLKWVSVRDQLFLKAVFVSGRDSGTG